MFQKGYARGDIKYNAELLAEQLAEDAGNYSTTDLGTFRTNKILRYGL